jgi:phosphoribosylanthranilate isomerase
VRKFRVKVCGITRPSDARLVVELGGDMIGMIFFLGSPRFVSRVAARRITAALPPVVSRVGVFVDEKPDIMLRFAESLRLDFIQLHGQQPARVISRLQKEGYSVIQAVPIYRRADFRRVLTCRADLCLLDHQTEKAVGGTGETFDWSLTPPRKLGNLVLAGGISIHNVRRGVRLFDPLVIDVNSGVENSPGVKSPAKLRRFFRECDRIRYGK